MRGRFDFKSGDNAKENGTGRILTENSRADVAVCEEDPDQFRTTSWRPEELGLQENHSENAGQEMGTNTAMSPRGGKIEICPITSASVRPGTSAIEI